MSKDRNPERDDDDDEPAAEQQQEKTASFYLVVIADDAGEDQPPSVYRADTPKAFAALVREHVLSASEPLYAFAFKGDRIQISAPTQMCAISIEGESLTIGALDKQFAESGRIVPLKSAGK